MDNKGCEITVDDGKLQAQAIDNKGHGVVIWRFASTGAVGLQRGATWKLLQTVLVDKQAGGQYRV